MKHVLHDIGGRRLEIDRRQFSYSIHVPERRSCKERRSGFDKRKHRRFQIQDDAFAAIRSETSKLGTLENISRGGLAFRYVADEEQILGSFEMDIFSREKKFYLKSVPFRAISDSYIDDHVPFSTLTMSQCRGQFGKLTHDQMSMLDYFLVHHTAGEA
jgi:hypothetical protein